MFKTTVKSLAIASVIAASGAAAFAAGSDHIFTLGGQDVTTHVELDLVRASGNGTVDVYSFHKGIQGELLGSAAVHAGANLNVDVNLDKAATTDVIAVLNIAGQNVAYEEIDRTN